jgi:hypothetical protein
MERQRVYPFLELPLSGAIKEMSKPEGKSYLKWFQANRKSRACVLANFLGLSDPSGPGDVQKLLGAAALKLSEVAYDTALDAHQLASLQESAGPLLAPFVPLSDLSEETTAFCYDLGVVLGMYLECVRPESRLSIELGSRNNADFGQIVLLMPDEQPVNPFRLCTVLARKVIKGAEPMAELDRLLNAYGVPAR